MTNYIYTNSKILINKFLFLINNSKIKNKIHNCPICSKKFNKIYIDNTDIIFKESEFHLLEEHYAIDLNLYNKLCNLKINNLNINWCLLNTNDLNIIDGLYEIGSNQIYISKNKNIFNNKILRFSEHSGFIYFKNEKVDKVVVLNNSRTDKDDPLIYMPNNSLEALNVDYLYHTHPKTPFIGSRLKDGILYEFPSISDIIHFIEHHNNGKLLGSIIFSPEGIYIIYKLSFNRNKIKIDYDIIINKLEETFMECYEESYLEYSSLNYNSLKTNGEIKIPEKYFYKNIANNFTYIQKINNILKNYDLYIDYYPRLLETNNKWIFPNIYVPFI